MDTRAVARAHLLITAVLTCAAALLTACVGYFIGGPVAAIVSGSVTAAGAAVGSMLVRRRVFANLEQGMKQAGARGYAEGISQGALLGIATYQAAVFPLTGPDGVSAEEQAARRTIAYQIAADDGLPHTVRTAAAAALEAIDGRDGERAQEALQRLTLSVHEQRTSWPGEVT